MITKQKIIGAIKKFWVILNEKPIIEAEKKNKSNPYLKLIYYLIIILLYYFLFSISFPILTLSTLTAIRLFQRNMLVQNHLSIIDRILNSSIISITFGSSILFFSLGTRWFLGTGIFNIHPSDLDLGIGINNKELNFGVKILLLQIKELLISNNLIYINIKNYFVEANIQECLNLLLIEAYNNSSIIIFFLSIILFEYFLVLIIILLLIIIYILYRKIIFLKQKQKE